MLYQPEPQHEEAAIVLVVGLAIIFSRAILRYYYGGALFTAQWFRKIVPLTSEDKAFLSQNISPFNTMSTEQKTIFINRLQWLKSKKEFVFHGDIVAKDLVKLQVCSAISLLTMGFSSFSMVKSVARVVVYPTKYYSKIRRRHHLGEYHPKLRVLVFSEDTLKHGFAIPNDNKNLAVHEIAHALCFETKGERAWQAKKFQVGLRLLSSKLKVETFRNQLEKDNYLRGYGLRNVFEFFAILTENYLETPNELNARYPELYAIVRTMYAFDFTNPTNKKGFAKEL